MQCPDCKQLRHNGPCDPVYEEPGEEEQRQFWEEVELMKAKDLVRAGASPLEEGVRR